MNDQKSRGEEWGLRRIAELQAQPARLPKLGRTGDTARYLAAYAVRGMAENKLRAASGWNRSFWRGVQEASCAVLDAEVEAAR